MMITWHINIPGILVFRVLPYTSTPSAGRILLVDSPIIHNKFEIRNIPFYDMAMCRWWLCADTLIEVEDNIECHVKRDKWAM